MDLIITVHGTCTVIKKGIEDGTCDDTSVLTHCYFSLRQVKTMWEDSNNHIVATQVTGVSTALNNLEDFICNKLHLRALVCKLCRGNRHLNAVSQARLSALLTNGGSTESRRSTSDTNHSSHDDLLNHILACMPPSARQANNVRLHIKTSGSVITSLCVDVLSVGVLLLFLSPRQTV